MIPIKSGWKTSEFWITTVLGGLTMLTTLGVIGPAEGDYVRGHIQQWAALATALIAVGYQVSRAVAKHHWHEAAQLIGTEITALSDGTAVATGKMNDA